MVLFWQLFRPAGPAKIFVGSGKLREFFSHSRFLDLLNMVLVATRIRKDCCSFPFRNLCFFCQWIIFQEALKYLKIKTLISVWLWNFSFTTKKKVQAFVKDFTVMYHNVLCYLLFVWIRTQFLKFWTFKGKLKRSEMRGGRDYKKVIFLHI